MANKFIHLTNASIQKFNTEPVAKDNPLSDKNDDVGGSKISLLGANGLWQKLAQGGIDTDLLWRNICLIVLKSLVVVDEKMVHQPCCFEVFGYDVIMDSDLRPWLLEVNASPSLARENGLDYRVKNAMIRDTTLLVNPLPFDRAAVTKVLKKRLNDMTKNKFTMSKNDPDLESDLKAMLGNAVPRRYGEEPRYMGDYQRLCPDTKLFEHVMRLKGKLIKPLK
jgi:hypothetical protein